MNNLQDLKLGLAFSISGEPVIVMGQGGQHSFAVWNQQGVLWIYDSVQGDVQEPLHAATVWDAMVLFTTWCSCVLDDNMLQ